MSALAFDFDFGPEGDVATAPAPRRRLYAVRGTVDAPTATAVALAPATEAPSLDVILGGAWTALASGAQAACPVCPSTLRPRRSAGSGFAGGRCEDCGTTLR